MIYRFTCDACASHSVLLGKEPEETSISVPMNEMGEHMYPSCLKGCGVMRRLYSSDAFGAHQHEKGIFPLMVENMGSDEPVRIESRAHLKAEMKARGLSQADVSDNARAFLRAQKRRFY